MDGIGIGKVCLIYLGNRPKIQVCDALWGKNNIDIKYNI